MSNGVLNGAMNRKALILLGPVAGLVMFAGAIWIASTLVNREYKDPYRAPAATVDVTPRVGGIAAVKADAESKDRERSELQRRLDDVEKAERDKRLRIRGRAADVARR